MHERPIRERAWWTLHGRRFALATGISTTLVVALGWLTELRDVMHGALLSLAIAALLPFVIIAVAVSLILLVPVIAAIAAAFGDGAGDITGAVEGGAGLLEGGVRLVPKYYAFLGRRRHPVFWGIGAGGLLGGLLLWAFLAIFVMPGEARTTDSLHEARARIELYYSEHGELPQPDAEHRLVIDGTVIGDGFGRPLGYRVQGRWKLAVWQLRSAGYDGRPSRDDLCLASGTPLVRKLEAAAQLLELSVHTRSLVERLESVNTARCEN